MKKSIQTKKELWLSRIMACRQSGLPDVRWCKDNNINPSSLYYWINKLRAEAPEIVEKHKGEPAPYQQEVVPLHISSPQEVHDSSPQKQHLDTAVVIQAGALSLEIQNGATEETLKNTFQALRFLC